MTERDNEKTEIPQQHALVGAQGRSEPYRVRLPGFTAEMEVGLGEVIKRATSLVGIRPCGSCLGRAANLDRWMVLSGRR
jgi:hypothetical protein